MNATRDSELALVARSDPAHEPSFAELLASPDGAAARQYRTRDLNDVGAAVAAGAVKRVVFARLEDLLEGCWDEVIQLDQWSAAGARVEFAEPPGFDGPRTAALIYQSWKQWNRTRRRRQILAGAILSVLAIGAAFLLVLH